jgi:hypothetical protein
MNRVIKTGVAVAAVAAAPLTARQDVALKDLMPKGMVIGVAINQRQRRRRYSCRRDHHEAGSSK